ncbi:MULTISPECIES: hypothetical protein [Burkholderia cepacia complex]|uniref:Uncharacterized protein n=2 Tax=Burkholderia cepacia complex TaxID=87882 RepID=A0A228EDP4_9BURK|nr:MULTISPECIES: hypothetical protein [Burkholderia cepacia complex]AIO71518.1 putative membrane protein [Burkholderia multivorans]AOK69184.1 hypothetical protein WM33_26325 [Burkholderia multivorans]KVV34442.1 hypothetical protein WK80_03045 [Burkholderia multivorans]KVZ76032.1 hypothetical protein WL23_21765 [Burkholderia multivorans]MBJ9616003.1 hypothetical protein [Burkholderia multivorans]
MNAISTTASAVVVGFRALPSFLRRILLVFGFSSAFAAGAFMHNHGAGDLASLFLLVGGIGTLWASGAWRIVKFGLLLALIVSRD